MKGLALGPFQRKRAAVAVDHVDDQLGVFPVFVLRLAHVKAAAAYVAQVDVAGANGQLSQQVTIPRQSRGLSLCEPLKAAERGR